MYELMAVRLHAVGPQGARFDTALDLRSAPNPDVSSDKESTTIQPTSASIAILGDNGSGKTLLARLVRLVLIPDLLHHAGAPESNWQDVVSPAEVGQVVLEWHEPQRERTIITGLALQCHRDNSGLEATSYAIHSDHHFDINVLIPDQRIPSVDELHRHVERIARSRCSTDKIIWTARSKDWRAHLDLLGLRSTTVCLIDESDSERAIGVSSRCIRSTDDFLIGLIRQFVHKEDLLALYKLHSDAARSSSARATLLSRLSEIVKRFLDELALVEQLSAFPTAHASAAQASLVECAFPQPSDDEIEKRIEISLDRYSATSSTLDYQLILHAAKSATNNEISITVRGLAGNKYRIGHDRLKYLPGSEQDYITALLHFLFIRMRAVREGAENDGCVIFLDTYLRSAEVILRSTEIMATWHLQVILLSANADVDINDVRSIFVLQAITKAGSDDRFTTIARAVTLAAIRIEDCERSGDPAAAISTAPLVELFVVLAESADIKPGDFLVPTVRRVGGGWPVELANQKTLPALRRRHLTILRPRNPLREGEDLFYASYFGSDAFLGKQAQVGQLIFIPAQELAEIRLPRPDGETLRAINELTTAAATFDGWRRDADSAVRSFFQWRDLATARADMIQAGRLTRQRREAAHLLDTRGPRFRTTLPYPIARRWRDVEAAPEDESGYRRILDCAEVSITYCAALGLAFAAVGGIRVPRLRVIAGRLRHGKSHPTFGDWEIVVQNLTEMALTAEQPPDSPLRNYRHFANGVNAAIKALRDRRNDISHGRGPTMHKMSDNFALAKTELEKILCASEWLVDYPLRYLETEQWDSFTDTSTLAYRELMGDHNVVSLGRDEAHGHLECHSAYVVDQFGKYYLLRPFFHTEYCRVCGALSVFVIDGWNPVAQQAEYKAMDHAHVAYLKNAHPGLQAVWLLH